MATTTKTKTPTGTCGLTLRINGEPYRVRPLRLVTDCGLRLSIAVERWWPVGEHAIVEFAAAEEPDARAGPG